MKSIIIALGLIVGVYAQTAKFPTAVVTIQDLGKAKDASSSTLNGGINNSTLTVVVADGTQFTANQIVQIDSEQMQICSIATNTLTICTGTRGFAGTSAASHLSGAAVRGVMVSWYINALGAEVAAIAGRVLPARAGTSLPGTCVASKDLFVDIDASPSPTFHLCNGTGDGWTQIAGGGGSGGSLLRFAPTSGSGTAYSGTVTDATYANGLTLVFIPDVTNTGSATLNINSQGAVTLYRRSGNALSASYLKAGKPYVITYEDGAFYLNEQDFAVDANATLAFDWTANPPTIGTTNLVCITTGTCAPTGYQDQSGASWRPPEKTVSTLPTAASNTGKVFIVTDGTSVTDCTVGGGSTRAFCVSNGFAWVTLAGAGGSSQRTLLYESLNQSPVTGDGNQKTFASYEIASGTLTTGDKIQVEALLLRTGSYTSEPNFGMILGNGGLPMSGYGTNSNIVALNIEWQVTDGTTVVGSGWGNRGTAFAVDTTDEYKYTATTNFDTSAANTVTLRTESVHIATDEVVRLVYFRVWRLRP